MGNVLAANAGFAIFPDRETVAAPDAACIQPGHEPQGDARWHFARLVPDLVVEVCSASDRAQEMQAEVARCQEAGVPLVWARDSQARTVTVLALGEQPHRLAATDTLDGGQVLPEFQVSVTQIFAWLRLITTRQGDDASPAPRLPHQPLVPVL